MSDKPKGMFARLKNGDLPTGGKRWPSDSGAGVMFVLPTCTGTLSTTSVPLTRVGPIPPDHVEPGKAMSHAEFTARNKARAQAVIESYTKPK